MNRDFYFRQVVAQLYPLLKQDGFKGSGTTLRRTNGPVVHVFNFQGSSGGNCCYINLGVHLDFLPTEGEQECDPKKITESQCSFRQRLEPPAGSGFGWHYGATVAEASESLEMLIEYWRVFGQPYFAGLASYPLDFLPLIDQALGIPPHPCEGLKLARLAIHMRRKDLALSLAEQALPKVGERATGLRENLEAIIETCPRSD